MRTPRIFLRACVGVLVSVHGGCGEGAPPAPVEDPLPYASPFIGSGGFGFEFGSAFPGAAAPAGLAKVGPDTRGPWGTINFLHYSGYWYSDHIIEGFSHLHLHGTGATDYGVLGIMPTDGFDASRTDRSGRGVPFRKETERAEPGYYAVGLDRTNGTQYTQVEVTATPHAAHHRYAFDQGADRHVIIDLDHHLEGGRVEEAELRLNPGRDGFSGRLRSLGGMSGGYGGYTVYFSARVRPAWSAALSWADGAQPAPGEGGKGKGVGAALSFGRGAENVDVQVGLSLVSEDGARRNLMAEMPGWDFEGERRATAAAWRELLKALVVEGGGEDERRMFYSALYRTYLMPTVQSDVDGAYHGHDGKPQLAEGFRFQSDLSLWDTYRTVHSLYALIAPEHARDGVRSLHEMGRQRGFFPKWPLAGGDSGSMIGSGADIVVADSYLRGVRDFDAEGAYRILRAAALNPTPPPGGRGGRSSEDYLRLGYVPAPHSGSVSLTAELARDDAALANLAEALGHREDAALLRERAKGWRRLFDPGSGFLRARQADGQLAPGSWDPTCFCMPYTEANAWQTLFLPSHDLEGLSGLLGGHEGLLAALERFFELAKEEYEASDPEAQLVQAAPRPFYWAGNETDIHAAYLFTQLGRQDLAGRWARWSMTTHYGPGPDGLPGNDDGGTMSAWYLWSALGLYPEVGTDRYLLGAPLFPRVRVRVPGGVFTIEAEGQGTTPREVTLDGVPVPGGVLRHKEIRAGRTLRFVLTR